MLAVGAQLEKKACVHWLTKTFLFCLLIIDCWYLYINLFRAGSVHISDIIKDPDSGGTKTYR